MKTALTFVMAAFIAFLTANAAEQAPVVKKEAPQATTGTTAKPETVTTQTPAPEAEVTKSATDAQATADQPVRKGWLSTSTSGLSGKRTGPTKAEIRKSLHDKLVSEYLAASRFIFTPDEMRELGVSKIEQAAYSEAYEQHQAAAAKAAAPAAPAPAPTPAG